MSSDGHSRTGEEPDGFAWYTASAMMLASVMGRTILPLGKYSRSANVPGRTPTTAVELEYGEPGVKKGQ